MLKIAPKALHFLKKNGTPPPSQERPTAPTTPPPSVPSLRRLTSFIIPHKNRFIISVYISNVFASLVVQF